MLVHQEWSSEGESFPSVNLTNRNVLNVRQLADCHTGIKLDSDGVLYLIQNNGGFSQVTGEWLVVGDAEDYYVQHTVTDGTLQTEPGSGWNQLNVDRIYESVASSPNQMKDTTVFFEIADDAAGSNIITTATMLFRAEYLTLD